MPRENSSPIPPLQGGAVLVTGGTGFTGRRLLRALAGHGLPVRATARPTSSREGLEDLDIDWRVGKLHDEAFARDLVEGVEYIFHLASNYRETHRSRRSHEQIHVISTQHLARAASKQEGFKRFVHVSSVGVHGHVESPPASETAPFAAGDVYQETKMESEQWLAAYAGETGLPVVVVRPAAIYGPGDRRLLKVFKLATRRLVPLIGYGQCLYHLVHVDDLVDFLTMVAHEPSATGEAYICAGEEPITIEAFIRCAGACYGVKNRFVRIPAWPVMGAAVACDAVCKVLRVQPPLYPRRVAFFTKDRAFDTTKVRQLGFQPRHDNEEGIVETAQWYLEHGWVRLREGASG